MSLSDLEDMVKKITEGIISVDVEHDPRKIPVGRIISAKIIELEDGEYGVEGIIEFFDLKNDELTDTGTRQLVIRDFSSSDFTVCYDKSFNNQDNIKDIEDLCLILNTTNRYCEIKKALEPISTITIAASFFLGSITSGFLEKIGIDAYQLLKKKIWDISKRKQKENSDILYIFEFTIFTNNLNRNVQLLIYNPSNIDIELAIACFLKLDEILPIIFSKIPESKKLVFEFLDRKLKFKYGLDNKGIPILPNNQLSDE